MRKDIYFLSQYELCFEKLIFAESEVSLARCLNFHLVPERSAIICDLQVTSKISVIEFCKEAFPRIWSNPNEEQFKKHLLDQIDFKYAEMYKVFEETLLPKLGYHGILRQHQKDALFETRNRKHTLLAFDLGLGKTLIGGSISKMLSIRRTLIITPSTLKWNWKMLLCSTLSKFNELYFSILDPSKTRTIKAFQERFVICSYDNLDKWMDHILSSPIGHIICDEVVSIKSTSTKRFKMVDKIAKENLEAKITLMSGRPVRNRINDLFSYLRLTRHPLGDNYAKFLRDFLIMSKGRGPFVRITGAKNLDVLQKQLSNFMLRRKIEDCEDLPAKNYNRIYFSLDDFKEEYERSVLEALEKSGTTTLNSSISTINIITAKAKLKGVIEFADSIIEQGEKVVLFSGYTTIVESLKDHFKETSVLINGAVNSYERSIRVKRFMEDESCKVFIGNTIAAGSGLTLTAANKMIFIDLPFSAADLAQAEARIFRIGQTKPVSIYYAIATDSIDEHIYSIIVNKAHDADMVVDGKISANSIGNENFSDILISELRKKYNIPEPVSE